MDQDITLDDLAPRRTTMQKVTLVLLLVLITAILVVSYIWTGISPMKLYKKKRKCN